MTEPTVILPTGPAPKPRRKPLIAAGLAIPVVLIAGGAFAYQQLNGGGSQPAEVLPADVVAYARLDANPSAAQKIKLFKLIKKSPELAKEIGIKTDEQDLRKDIVEKVIGSCDNVDYDKDIKPWLGDRIGIAAESDTSVLVAVQVSDEKAARKGIKLATSCQNLTDPGIAFAKGYAVIGESQQVVDAAVKSAAAKPLSEKPAFVEDMNSLGDNGIASVWVDIQAAAKSFDEGVSDSLAGLRPSESVKNERSAAIALRADGDSVELAGISHHLKDLGTIPTVKLGNLPRASVLAASIAGGGAHVDEQWSALTEEFTESEVNSMLKGLEEQTGFVLPGDLKKLLGDRITVVIGDKNLQTLDQLEGPSDIAKLDAAIALTSDRAGATEIAKKIAGVVAEFTGFDLAVVSTDDGAVLATNEDFATSFDSGKDLSDKDSFASVIDHADSANGGFFLDIARIIDVAGKADLPASDQKDLEQLKILKALGFSASTEGDRVTRGTLKLSFR